MNHQRGDKVSDHGYDMDQLVAHTTYSLANTIPRHFPYRHLMVDDFLDPDLFAALCAIDTKDLVKQRRESPDFPTESNRFVLHVTDPDVAEDPRMPPCIAALRDFVNHQAITGLLMRHFSKAIGELIPFKPPIINQVDLIEDRAGYELLPHTDVRQKLVTTIIYLAKPGDDPSIGTEVYIPRSGFEWPEKHQVRWKRSDFVRATTAPYKPNGAFVFHPTKNSFHGVGRFNRPGQVRKLLQFQINVDVPKYNAMNQEWEERQAREKSD